MKILKSGFLLLLVAVVFSSCLGDDRNDQPISGFLPVSKVVVPTTINPPNEVTKIDVTYVLTNGCQSFVRFQTHKQNDVVSPNTYEVAVMGLQQGSVCTDNIKEETKQLEFKPESAGEYTLKFWAGYNADQTEQFKTVVISVPAA